MVSPMHFYTGDQKVAKADKPLQLFPVKRFSTNQILLVAGRSKFEACEALAGEFPDEDADDFEFLQENTFEVVTGEFGGVAVLADITE